jgi:glycosyltransferase involved in cell wall biosynthesis
MIPPKKIGIILYNYPLGASSSLINSARLFAKNGYEVYFFVDRDSYNKKLLNFSETGIHIFLITKRQMLFGNLFLNDSKYSVRSKIVPAIDKFASLCFIFLNFLSYMISLCLGNLILSRMRSCQKRKKFALLIKIILFKEDLMAKEIVKKMGGKFDFIIGSDAHGLIIARNVAKKDNTNLIYYNLELLLESECKSTYELVIKETERVISRKCIFTIIPDASRSQLFQKDNGIENNKIVLLPVSALSTPVHLKSAIFHEMFNISPDKKIVLYAGNLVDWSLCLEIAYSAKNWPDQFVFIIHTWRENTDAYIEKIKKIVDNQKIFLSTKPVSWDDLPHLLSGADIGLVFYKNLGKNFYETGLSSNKMAQYLQVGLPVITSDYPTFHQIIQKYRCGKCTNNINSIGVQLEEIFLQYDLYRKNAFMCFNEIYDFSQNFNKVILKIKEL